MTHAHLHLATVLTAFIFGTLLSACAVDPAHQDTQTPAQASTETAAPEVAEAEEKAPFPDNLPSDSTQSSDIWDRMRDGFALPQYNDQPKVAGHIDWHRCHIDYMQRVTARSEPFLHLILDEVQERGMPTELALLPIVESAFLPYAYSHGRAAGLWQFIPATGRHYGLKQNWWYDGRRDVLAATHAALDYLQTLNKHFDGDWLLALAAYNAGERKVRREMTKNKKRGLPTDFWHLDLPRETRNYVPKLLAAAAVIGDPEFYGIDLWPIADEPYLREVTFDSQIDLAVVANLTDMDIEQIYMLNPGFNRWATDPNGPHHLLLPLVKADRFEQELAALPQNARVTWRRHKIEKGQTLGHIAREYHTTVSVLQQSNQLHGKRIRAGNYLLVPVSAEPPAHYSLSAQQRRQAQQAKAGSGRKLTHVVANGDTFWDIAQRYGVSVKQLAKWNAMAPRDVLRPGDRLVLWVPITAQESALQLPDLQRGIPGEAVRKVRYSVRRGDSLYAIAQRFSVEVTDIRRWNNLKKTNFLRPGQRLMLYIDVTQVDS